MTLESRVPSPQISMSSELFFFCGGVSCLPLFLCRNVFIPTASLALHVPRLMAPCFGPLIYMDPSLGKHALLPSFCDVIYLLSSYMRR